MKSKHLRILSPNILRKNLGHWLPKRPPSFASFFLRHPGWLAVGLAISGLCWPASTLAEAHPPVGLHIRQIEPPPGLPSDNQTWSLISTPTVRPGHVYRLESATQLGPDTGWQTVEPVVAESNTLHFDLFQPVQTQSFFRLRLPRSRLRPE